MEPGERVTWYTYRRDAQFDFIKFDAIITSVGNGWSRVEIEYLDLGSLFPQRVRRVVPGDRLMIRHHFVPELDGDVLSGSKD